LPSAEVNGGSEKRGEKRKFSLDADEMERIAEEERAKARRAIEDEKVCPLCLTCFCRCLANKSCTVSKTDPTLILDAISYALLEQEQRAA
jgi:hypothetical protein